MERAVESIKTLTKKKQHYTQTELLELIAACNDAARLFTVLIEEQGSTTEAPKVKYLRDEVRKTHQQALTQKEPLLSEDSVARLGQCVELLGEVAQKVPTNKKLQFNAAEAGEGGTQNADDTAAADAAEDVESEQEEEEEEELDSEAEFLMQLEADRQAQMGPAAWHVRLLHVLTLMVIILGCVGVVFVSSDQYDHNLEQEDRDTIYQLLSVAQNGMDIVASLSTSATITVNSEQFMFDMNELRVASTVPPVFRPSSRPLIEFGTVRYSVNIADGVRSYVRYTPRKFELLCLDDGVISVENDHDLRYTTNRTKNILHAQQCKSQTAGSGIWRRIGSDFFTYLPSENAYRTELSRQLGTLHDASGLPIEVQVERVPLSRSILPRDEAVGVVNPLAYKWQQSTALWASFAIAVGFLFCVMASEVAIWLAREDRMSDLASACVYAGCVALISLIVVISTASIAWTFLSDELDQHRLQNQQLVAYAAAAAVTSSAISSLGGTQLLVAALLNGALSGSGFTTDVLTSAIVPSTSATLVASSLSGSAAMATSGLYYSSGAYKVSSESTQVLATTHYMPSASTTLTVFREMAMGNVILDAGKRSAGPTLGVLGAQLALILCYFLLTPLVNTWSFAGGAVWVEQLLKPSSYRRVMYVASTAIVFAVALAVAFSAVADIKTEQAALASFSGACMAQSLSVASVSTSVTDFSVINQGLPSYADATVYHKGTPPYLVSGQSPRFPLPTWVGWEANNYGSSLSLTNFSTSVLAPAYFTPQIDDATWSRSSPDSMEWMLTSTAADPSGVVGVSLQRFPQSYQAAPMRAYRIYVSFVFAALFACLIAFALFEMMYRSASNARLNDEYDDPTSTRLQSIAMFVVLLLPVFAVLIGAGGSAHTVRSAVDEYAHRELSWQAAAMKPILEHVASNAAETLQDDNYILTTMSTFVDALNTRVTRTVPVYYRWLLLQETPDYTLTKVFPIAGADTHNSFFLSNMQDMSVQPQLGTLSSGFYSSSARRTVTYAAVEVINSMLATATPKPATFVMLVADYNDVDDRSKRILTQLYKVSGTCTVVLALILSITFAYIYGLFESRDFPVLDEEEVLPILTTESAIDHQDVVPPMLPSSLRFAHIFVLGVVVVALIFFMASMTYGVQYSRTAVEATTQTRSMYDALDMSLFATLTNGLNYVRTGLLAQQVIFAANADAFGTSGSVAGTTLMNTTSAATIASSFSTAAALTATLSSGYDDTALVQSMTESYRSYALTEFAKFDELDTVVAYFDSVVARLQVCSNHVATSTAAVSSTFNATAVAMSVFHLTEMIDAISKLSVLKKVAINSLLDFSDTLSDVYSLELSTDAAAIKAAVRTAALDLQSRVTTISSASSSSGELAAALSTCAAQDANSAVSLVLQAAQLVVADNYLLDPTAAVWTVQRRHIMEAYTALRGDNGTLTASMNDAWAAMRASATSISDALAGEGNTRQRHDYSYQRSALHVFPLWSYLAPWTVSERVAVISDAQELYDAAVATTVIALVLVALSYALLSLLAFFKVALYTHDIAQDTADDKDSEDREFLLDKATHQHRESHRRSLLVVLFSLLLVCVPVGMAYWAATENASVAKKQIVDGGVSVMLQRVVDELPVVNSLVLYDSVSSYMLGNASTLSARLAQYGRLVAEVQSLVMLQQRLAVRTFQTTGNTMSDSEAFRVSLILNSLQTIADLVLAVQTNFTVAKDEYAAAAAAGSNSSNLNVLQQRLAGVYGRGLVAATTAVQRDAVLAPIAPVSSTSSLATYVASLLQDMLTNCSAATTDAQKRTVASQLVTFTTTMTEPQIVLRGFTDFWSLQSSTFRHNTAQLRAHGNFSKLSAAYLSSSTSFSTSARSDIAALFLRLVQVTTPATNAIEVLFSTTAPVPWSTVYTLSTDLADQLLAAAATATYFNSTTQMTTFIQRFSFNRNLLTAAALALNVDYTLPLKGLMSDLVSAVNNLTAWSSVVQLPLVADAGIAQQNTVAARLVRIAATSLTPLYGIWNPEYATVAVEWVCIFTMWAVLGTVLHVILHMRILFL